MSGQFDWDPDSYLALMREEVPRYASLQSADVDTPIDGVYDRPSTVADQLAWLRAAELDAEVAWLERDLAVLLARA